MRKADRVTQDLMRRIVSGVIPVGSLLPRESDLAEVYGVNRSVIREAIKLLEVHRLVQPVRRRGTMVLDPMASLSAEVLQQMLTPEPGRVDVGMLASYLEVRAQLDLQMTTLAAQRRTPSDLEAIDSCVDDLSEALGDPREYAQTMGRLALCIARSTHNVLFEMLVHWHQRVQSELEGLFLSVRLAIPPHLQGIRALVEAIRREDAAFVERLVRAFHEWATPRLLAAAMPSAVRPGHGASGGTHVGFDG